jgi:hypothetical protein
MILYPAITLDQWNSVNAAVLSHGRREASKPSKALGLLGGAVIGAALALVAINPSTRLIGVALMAGYWTFYFLCRVQQRKRLAAVRQQSFEDLQPILNGTRMEVDALGIRGTWVGEKATYDFRWTAFADKIDRAEELVFLYAPCCYVRVPRACVDHEALQQITLWFDQSRPAFNRN